MTTKRPLRKSIAKITVISTFTGEQLKSITQKLKELIRLPKFKFPTVPAKKPKEKHVPDFEKVGNSLAKEDDQKQVEIQTKTSHSVTLRQKIKPLNNPNFDKPSEYFTVVNMNSGKQSTQMEPEIVRTVVPETVKTVLPETTENTNSKSDGETTDKDYDQQPVKDYKDVYETSDVLSHAWKEMEDYVGSDEEYEEVEEYMEVPSGHFLQSLPTLSEMIEYIRSLLSVPHIRFN